MGGTLARIVEGVVSASRRLLGLGRGPVEGVREGVEVLELEACGYSELLTSSAAVDVASASLYLGESLVGVVALAAVLPDRLVVCPELPSERISGPPFISTLAEPEEPIEWVTDRYVELGVPYRDGLEADAEVLESDVRLYLEPHGLTTALGSRVEYVLVDGPLVPALRLYSRPGHRPDELALHVSRRAHIIKRAVSEGKVVIGVVKRVVARSAEIPRLGKPAAVGPFVLSGELRVCSFHLVEDYAHASTRVEMSCDSVEALGRAKVRRLLSALYSSYRDLALPVPYGVYAADRVSKSVVRRLLELLELTAKSRGILAIYPGEQPHG